MHALTTAGNFFLVLIVLFSLIFFSSSSVSQASLDREDGMFEVCVWCNVMCLCACVCVMVLSVCVCVDKCVCEGVV